MSARVDAARKMFNAFQSGDVATAMGEFHPECQVHEADSLAYGGTHKGHEGFMTIMEIMGESLDVSVSDQEVFDAGDTVVIRVQATFVSRKSGRKLCMPLIEIYKYEGDGDKVIDADIYYKDAGAVADLARDTEVVATA
jgi:ketosteroid isomerase-like protein